MVLFHLHRRWLTPVATCAGGAFLAATGANAELAFGRLALCGGGILLSKYSKIGDGWPKTLRCLASLAHDRHSSIIGDTFSKLNATYKTKGGWLLLGSSSSLHACVVYERFKRLFMSVDFIASLHCKAMLWTMTFLKFNESEDRVNRLIISIINVLMGSCTASHVSWGDTCWANHWLLYPKPDCCIGTLLSRRGDSHSILLTGSQWSSPPVSPVIPSKRWQPSWI